MGTSLEDLLPIRRIFYAAVEQVFVRDIEFDALGFTFTVDASKRKATIALSGNLPFLTSSFGTDTTGKNNAKSFIEPAFTTANATPQNAVSAIYAMPDLTVADVIITVVGKKVGSSDRFCQDYRARYYRNGGAPNLDGSIISGSNPMATGTLATAAATLAISGNNIVAQVTGVAATNITWTIIMQVQPVTTAT